MNLIGAALKTAANTISKRFLIFLLFIPIAGVLAGFTAFTPQGKSLIQKSTGQEVLGRNTSAPQIYVSNGDQGLNAGGVIAIASTDEPAVYIGGYNSTGKATVGVFKSDGEAVLNYLLHDKDGKQTNRTPNTSKMTPVVSITHQITGGYEGTKVPLPLEKTGVWYLSVKFGDKITHAFVVRSDVGVLTEEGDNELIFWGQNFTTKRSITEGSVKVLNLTEKINELSSSSFDSEGIAKTTVDDQADIATVESQGSFSIVPLNLKYLNDNYSYEYKNFFPKPKNSKYFIFTDRPIYKPGDKVNFKAVLRNDDDARYTIPTGNAIVKIYDGYYYEGSDLKSLYEKTFPISPDGTVNGTYSIPTTGKPGYYSLYINIGDQPRQNYRYSSDWSNNYVSFNVEYYRKPEFFLNITSLKSELIAGQDTTFTISGDFFSGQPLAGQRVKYNVYAGDFYEYEYATDYQNITYNLNNDFRYGIYAGNSVKSGTAVLNKNGQAIIKLPTKMHFNKGKSQVFSITATIEDGSINPASATKNILVYAGDFGIYREGNYSYSTRINTPLKIPLIIIPNEKEKVNISNIELTADIKRETWVSYQESNKKYPSYKREVEYLPNIKVRTDAAGKVNLSFVPTKAGYYTITISAKDARGNNIEKIFYSYAYSEDLPYYTQDGNNDLTISMDKKKYNPDETANFSIHSTIPNRDILFALERGRIQRYRVVHMDGTNANVEIPLTNTDIPNVYAKAASFSDFALDYSTINVPVSSDSKKLKVQIDTGGKTFGPGETVNMELTTTDIKGAPISANVALWLVDKAIYELAENNLDDIFDTFWKERYDSTVQAHSLEGILVQQAEQGGGCFAQGTEILMADGSRRNIENIKPGDYVATRSEKDKKLISGKVLSTHQTTVAGYLIINGHLRVTDNHVMRVNSLWKEAGSIQIGDTLIDTTGKEFRVDSLEWLRGKFEVYNFEVEKYHTYFANGVWVHNQKGAARLEFKDTAYWNPEIHTDTAGKAKVSFKLPDNLTTWAIAAVGSTKDTRVGQTTDEIITTKDVIVRPIIPNLMRVGDSIILSTLVQNFSGKKQAFDISLKFDSGSVENVEKKNVSIENKTIERFYWKVKPTKVNEKSKLTFSAKALNNTSVSDTIISVIPVIPFGFIEESSEAGQGNKTFSVKLAKEADPDRTSIKLSLASTLVGSLPDAMKYLIQYPYGCVEQTTSRFVPAVIAKIDRNLFPTVLADKNINNYIDKGVARLSTLQQPDGGWTWWFTGKTDPYITSYVVEYLLLAKTSGTRVEQSMLDSAKRYLEFAPENVTNQHNVARAYGLTLLGDTTKIPAMSLEGLTPDYLSLAVMTNYLNGYKNPDANGLNKLIGMAKSQGDSLYWDSGNEINFGSEDASTALAIRAIIMAGGDRNLAEKGILYLTRTREHSYWSNTYATSQVIRAITEFAKTGNELTPSYNYAVDINGNQISQGRVSQANQIIKPIDIPAGKIRGNEKITVKKSGSGQIYSTMTTSQFITDRNAKAVSNGVYIKRTYANDKGRDYSFGVGDTVQVNLTVGGLKNNVNYLLIKDELPSGLIPVNENLLNEQNNYGTAQYDYNIMDRETTLNGMNISIYQATEGERTYSYKARVINEGTFIAPPASVVFMYQPEINARTGVATVSTVAESSVRLDATIRNFAMGVFNSASKIIIALVAFIVIVLGVSGELLHLFNAEKRKALFEKIKNELSHTSWDGKNPPTNQ